MEIPKPPVQLYVRGPAPDDLGAYDPLPTIAATNEEILAQPCVVEALRKAREEAYLAGSMANTAATESILRTSEALRRARPADGPGAEKSQFCEEVPGYDENKENPKCCHGVRWSHFNQCAVCSPKLKIGKTYLTLHDPLNPWNPNRPKARS
jgi:hypothetical protein